MSKIEGPFYGGYTTAMGCAECDYIWRPLSYVHRMPPMPPPSICPDCGGKTHNVLGRWLYSVKVSWWGWHSESIVHKFVKGRE